MTLQKRLKRIMRRRDMRVADLARALGAPYTTVREWVLHGRKPDKAIEKRVAMLERQA
jgi:DNA-binding transcriptional regulator YiaG